MRKRGRRRDKGTEMKSVREIQHEGQTAGHRDTERQKEREIKNRNKSMLTNVYMLALNLFLK